MGRFLGGEANGARRLRELLAGPEKDQVAPKKCGPEIHQLEDRFR